MKFKASLKPRIFGGMFNGFDPKKFDSLIGVAMHTGAVEVDGTLRIDGVVNGDITPLNDAAASKTTAVIVGKTGVVNGNIKADVVLVEGTVNGNVMAVKQIVGKSGGKIDGDVTYNDIAIETGFHLHGHIYHQVKLNVIDTPDLKASPLVTAEQT